MVEWLNRHWVASAFCMGVLLIALVPLLVRSWTPAMLLVYAQLPVYMLHQVEEHTGDRFRTFVNQSIFGGAEALNAVSILWINIPGVWGVCLVSLYAGYYAGAGWGLSAVYLTLVNAIVHIAGGVARRAYNPGLWTALALFVPLSGLALRVMFGLAEVTAIHHFIGLGTALGIHAGIVLYAKSRAAGAGQ